MANAPFCPVPKEQRPQEEFLLLRNSLFFSWPIKSNKHLYMSLILTWLFILAICIFIEQGSYVLRTEPIKLLFLSTEASLAITELLLIRQWLGWSYINKRLTSEKIEYEESGWYDGNTWTKPLPWKHQDLLIAQYEVRPIIRLIIRTFSLTLLIMLGVASIYKSL